MQQIRITRTADLNGVLSFLKARYPLLSEAEIVKMALSKQYYQEAVQQGGKAMDEIPNKYLIGLLRKAKADLKKGETSPKFKTAEGFIEYLHKQIE